MTALIMAIQLTTGMRGDEITAMRTDAVHIDLDDSEHGLLPVLTMNVGASKTRTAAQGDTRTLACADSLGGLPILKCLREYLEKAKKSRVFFFSKKKYPKQRMTTDSVRKLVQRAMDLLGEVPTRYGAHSGRVGMVSTAMLKGIPGTLVKVNGGWRSQCWKQYFNAQRAAGILCSLRISGVDECDANAYRTVCAVRDTMDESQSVQ
jgi:hypothetical protein